MLILKRITQPYEVRKCAMSDEMIIYGDFYYEDDEDGTVIKASVYKKKQQELKFNQFDYTLLAQAQSDKEYREATKRAQQQFLDAMILDRPIFDQGHVKNNGGE